MTFIKEHRSAIGAACAIALVYVIFALLGMGCPIKFCSGISCAGCGMTRAYLQVLRLDLQGAFHFHPLFWAVPIVAVLFLLKQRFPRVFRVAAGVTAALFILVYLVRMFDPNCDIVVFQPRDGVFYRIVSRLFGWAHGALK